MKQHKMVRWGVPLALVGTSLLMIQALWSPPLPEAQRSERINLALRQTAHELLRLEGNRTARIPPVQHLGAQRWQVSLAQDFNYDSLPTILHRALTLQRIQQDYNVAVFDCTQEELMLGYNSALYLAGKEVPCGGRERLAGCYELTVTLLEPLVYRGWHIGLSVALLLGGIGYGVYHFLRFKTRKILATPAVATPGQPFGQSVLDAVNQKLWVCGKVKDLTYREAKLLQFFTHHQNQLLERAQILKAVWEDEGVLVGRSVDVFVSRLRKLLKEDDTIKIVNVHSVGYRFEVHERSGME